MKYGQDPSVSSTRGPAGDKSVVSRRRFHSYRPLEFIELEPPRIGP